MRVPQQKRIILCAGLAIGLGLVMFAARFAASPLYATDSPEQPALIAGEGGAGNSCRYGAAIAGANQMGLVDELAAGVYLDFGRGGWDAANVAQYLPLITVKEDKDVYGNYLGTFSSWPNIESSDPNDSAGLLYWLVRHPGEMWTIGNEIERGPDPGQTSSNQGDLHAEVYAEAYHEIRQYIKQYDATARTAFASLVEVTPLRLAYLDAVWAGHIAQFGYAPQVDAWTMHLYILPEVNSAGNPNSIANIPVGMDHLIQLAKIESDGTPDQCHLDEVYCYAEHDDMGIFAEQVVAMRQWMKAKGQQNRPLLLTEYSLLYPYEIDPGGCYLQDEYGNCFTPERVRAFMQASMDYLDSASDPNLGYPFDGGRLVQQWVWFSIYHQLNNAGRVSDLYEQDVVTIRELGQMFADRAAGSATTVNLKPDTVGNPVAETDGTGTADVEIWGTFRNNGTTYVAEPFVGTFYANAALTNAIGSVTVTPDPMIVGCAQMNYRVSVTWNDLAPGLHKYWLKIDSANDIAESNEGDNVIQGRVIVDGKLIQLPIMFRP